MKTLIAAIFSLFFLFISNSQVSAQSCGGSTTCCPNPLTLQCQGGFDVKGNCLGSWIPVCVEATFQSPCTYNGSCVATCTSDRIISQNCYVNTCPANQNYCAATSECCPNTQTCNEWAAAGGCGGSDPGPTGPPGPPSCTPRANGWGNNNNRPQFTNPAVESPNGGANWDATEGIYFVRTRNSDGQVNVTWSTPAAGINLIEYRFIPVDAAGANLTDSSGGSGCDHVRAVCGTTGGTDTNQVFQPKQHRYYKLRLRFRHECQSVWSSWREVVVRIDGQVSGQVFMLGAGATATQSGPNGICQVTGSATALTNSPITVTSAVDSYTHVSSLIAASGRYRTYIPYIQPGAITLTAGNLPVGQTVVCPVGGAYNSGNSSISAPHLSNGRTGAMVDVNFYVCNATALTNPTGASITSPTQDQQVVPSGTPGSYFITLNFTKPTGTQVEYRVWEDGASVPVSGTVVGTLASTTATATFTPTTSRYNVDIRYTQSACGSTQTSSWSPVRSFNVVGEISGSVYDDPSGTASLSGGFCTGTGTLVGAGVVTADFGGGETYSDNVSGSYSITVPWGTSLATVNYTDGTGYLNGCPTNWQYASVNRIATNVNFFRTSSNDGWWQASGGPVMALSSTGVVLRSYIPTTATNPYLITQSGGVGTSGYVLTGQSADQSQAGQVDLSSDTGVTSTGSLDQDGRDIVAQTNPDIIREVYPEFLRRYQFSSERLRVDDFAGVTTLSAVPAAAPANTRGGGSQPINAYWTDPSESPEDTLTITGAWSVAAGQKIVVFVDENLRVEGTTTVAPGGFLAFIVSGNIIFDADLGQATPSSVTPVVEGVFLADGFLNLESRSDGATIGDLKFVGAGTFVGWSGVNLMRTFNDGGAGAISNNLYPAELFIHRPDFLLNAPEEMLRPQFVWREVAP